MPSAAISAGSSSSGSMPDGSTAPPLGPGSCLLPIPKLETSMPLRGSSGFATALESRSKAARAVAIATVFEVKSIMEWNAEI